MLEVAERRAQEQHLSAEQVTHLLDRVRGAAELGRVRSLREVERMVVRQYIEGLLGHRTSALIGREQASAGAGVA